MGLVGCQGHSVSQIAILAGCLVVAVSVALCSEGLNEGWRAKALPSCHAWGGWTL